MSDADGGPSTSRSTRRSGVSGNSRVTSDSPAMGKAEADGSSSREHSLAQSGTPHSRTKRKREELEILNTPTYGGNLFTAPTSRKRETKKNSRFSPDIVVQKKHKSAADELHEAAAAFEEKPKQGRKRTVLNQKDTVGKLCSMRKNLEESDFDLPPMFGGKGAELNRRLPKEQWGGGSTSTPAKAVVRRSSTAAGSRASPDSSHPLRPSLSMLMDESTADKSGNAEKSFLEVKVEEPEEETTKEGEEEEEQVTPVPRGRGRPRKDGMPFKTTVKTPKKRVERVVVEPIARQRRSVPLNPKMIDYITASEGTPSPARTRLASTESSTGTPAIRPKEFYEEPKKGWCQNQETIDWRTKVKKLMEELDEEKKKNKELMEESEEKEKKHKAQVDKLVKENDRLKEEDTVEQLKRQMMEDKLKDVEAENKKLVETKRWTEAELAQKVKELQKSRKNYIESLEHAEERAKIHEDLRTEKNEAEAAVAAGKEEIRELQVKLAELDQSIEQAHKRFHEAHERFDEKRAEWQKIVKGHEQSKKELEEKMEEDRKKAQRDLEDLNERKKEVEGELTNARENLESLKADSKNRLSELEQHNLALQAEKEAGKAALDQAAEEMGQLKISMNGQNEKISEMKDELAKCETAKESLKAILDEQTREWQMQEEEHRKSMKELEEKMDEEREKVQQDLEILNGQKKKLEEEIGNRVDLEAELKNRIRELEQTINEMVVEVAKYAADDEAMKKSLNEKTSEFEKKEEEL